MPNKNTIEKKVYPISETTGGIRIPHTPTSYERTHCAYAPKGHDCGRETAGPLGGRSYTMICAECPYHPDNMLIK